MPCVYVSMYICTVNHTKWGKKQKIALPRRTTLPKSPHSLFFLKGRFYKTKQMGHDSLQG